MSNDAPHVRGLYRHYKGGLYRVVALATDEATNIPLVVYRNVGARQTWVRPVADWNRTVLTDGPDNKPIAVPRFKREPDA